MLKARIQQLDVTYFLIDKHGYQRMNVVNPDLDLWLVNKDNSKYPIIRLTSLSLSEGLRQKEEILKQSKHMSNLLNIPDTVLSIHFNQQQQEEIQSDNYKQALVSDDYISTFLKNDFKDFQSSLKPIGEDSQKELKKRELKILDLDSKPTKGKKFSLKMVGPTQILIIINLMVFMGATLLETDYGGSLTAIILGGLYKNLIYGANEWWRLITAGFLHVDVFHILMNMIVLFQIGTLVERVYGKKQMLIIYMTSVVTSSLLALIMMDGGTISLGASGGVFGLLGAFIVYLFSSNLVKIPKIRNQIISTLMANLLISLIPGISFWGHFGGLVGGVLIAVAVSDAKMLKPAKIHAYISTGLIVVGMLFYSIVADNNVYGIRPEIDVATVQAYKRLGFEDHAESLSKNLNSYYQKIGETYE